MNNFVVFGGRGNPRLAQEIAQYLHVELGAVKYMQFPDGELLVKIDQDIRGRDVFIIQPTSYPQDTNLMELLIFIDCVRRASAARITAVIPYFGFARQDRKDEGRVPITAKLAANLITTAGANRVLTVDLHAAQIQGFFDIPVDNLYAEPVFQQYFSQLDLSNLALVSPDVGNTKRARMYADHLGGDLAIISKRRVSGSQVEAGRIIGEIEGRTVLMMDDMISTAGTVCAAAELCKKSGSGNVYVGATHGVLCPSAMDRLRDAPIDEVIVTDTIAIPQEKVDAIGKLRILGISELIGEAIHRIHNNESVSRLFSM